MRIVIVDSDILDPEAAERAIQGLLPGAEVVIVRSVCDLLLDFDDMKSADLIAMSRTLPLFLARLDHAEQFRMLHERYPEMATDWKADRGGYRLYQWLEDHEVSTRRLLIYPSNGAGASCVMPLDIVATVTQAYL